MVGRRSCWARTHVHPKGHRVFMCYPYEDVGGLRRGLWRELPSLTIALFRHRSVVRDARRPLRSQDVDQTGLRALPVRPGVAAGVRVRSGVGDTERTARGSTVTRRGANT